MSLPNRIGTERIENLRRRKGAVSWLAAIMFATRWVGYLAIVIWLTAAVVDLLKAWASI